MKLSEIKDPSVIKEMSVEEMNDLCQQIRSYLIETVSKTGGHLSSNLGVVELTVALHHVFQSPTDKIFFDVGHQCYTHKLLTGRYDSFPTLRSFNGLSGFQKRKESEHDVWEAGHASTSLSAAYGMAVARDLDHENYHIIPVIGDGSITGGMALEALDLIGTSDHKVIIIFNDNNMSISKNVGGINNAFARLRSSKSYTNLKKDVKSILQESGIGEAVLQQMQNIKDAFKKNVVDDSFFGEFGLEYFGPVDGHDLNQLIRILEVAKEHDGPVVIHVSTVKGKGYALCEDDKQGYWHGVGTFDPQTGMSLSSLPREHMSWSQIISETLVRFAKKDKDIVAITPAMITGSKLEKYFALYPDRSYDCGIAEEHAATFAAGLAISNKRPFLSLYSTFLQRAYDQINHDICRMDLPVVIGIDRAQLTGEDGETHHGVFDIGILRPLPNLILAQPKDSIEAQNMLYTAFHQSHPFAIRYSKASVIYHELNEFEMIPIGSWEIFNETEETKAYIITYGNECDRFIQKVKINQLPIAIVNARFIKPLDENMLLKIANANKPIFTYELDMLTGGLSSAILEFYNGKGITNRLYRYGIHDEYVQHGSLNVLKKELRLDINTFFEEVCSIMNQK